MLNNQKKFFLQTIQDTVALYYRLPIRQFDLNTKEEIFAYCKGTNFLKLDYTSHQTFTTELRPFLNEIPNFFNKITEKDSLAQKIGDLTENELNNLKNYLTLVRSSNSPFFIRALNEQKSVTVLKIIFNLYLLFSSEKQKAFIYNHFTFLEHTYKIYHDNTTLFLLGPNMTDENFDFDEKRIEYTKNIKEYFDLKLHTHELLNLLNHRNRLSSDILKEKATNIIKVLISVKSSFQKNHTYKKSELRSIATNAIQKNHNDSSVECIETKIKNNQISRDLEGMEWFNDLNFNYLNFGTSSEKHSNNNLDFLRIKLQADNYKIYYYDHAQKQILKEVCSITDEKIKTSTERIEINIKDSLTYDIISEYNKHSTPIRLIEDVTKMENLLICDEHNVKSILSIPLVFDRRVFAVLHFSSKRAYNFDNVDKRFLIKHSSAISKEYLECRANEHTKKMVTQLENLNKKVDYAYLQEKTNDLCKSLARLFSCDGVIVWFNKKEVFRTPKELNKLTILSDINFLEKNETEKFFISLDQDSSLIGGNIHKNIMVIPNIEECTDKEDDTLFMKYKKEFQSKKIKSLMFVPIKNNEGNSSGTIMIFDKSKRDYNNVAQMLLKQMTLHMGSILNTVAEASYRAKRQDEQNLHESAQYLNIIDSKSRELEDLLKKLYLPSSHDRNKIFLTIEDIKDYAGLSRNFFLNLFNSGELHQKSYDENINDAIVKIKENHKYISLNNSLNQILSAHEKRMNRTKDIIHNKLIDRNMYIKIPTQQLHDILNNMINNAIKYGKKGTYVKITDKEVAPYHYNIYIENIGYNIEEYEKEKIFQKGKRGSITKSEELIENEELQESAIGNKGLGLYFTKQLIKNGLGGNVTLLSSEKIGVTGYSKHIFVLKIPTSMTRRT
jgi:signal transduction histidine kinase